MKQCSRVDDGKRCPRPARAPGQRYCKPHHADAQKQQRDKLARCEEFTRAMAEHDCAYGDSCPQWVRLNHVRCDGCLAREALGLPPSTEGV